MQSGLDSRNWQALDPNHLSSKLQAFGQRSTSSSPSSSLSQQQSHVHDLLYPQLMQEEQHNMQRAADSTSAQRYDERNAPKPAFRAVPHASSALDKVLLQQQHALVSGAATAAVALSTKVRAAAVHVQDRMVCPEASTAD
jgi:hypothetical protein